MAKRKAHDDRDPRWTSELTPAPGDLRMVQAFLNTASPGQKRDGLANPRALADWLELWGLLPPRTKLGAGDLRRAVEVRGDLRSLVAANHGDAVCDEAVARLDQAVATAMIRVRFAAGGQARFEAADDALDGALARLCGIVVMAQFGDAWSRLRICLMDSCHAVYFTKDSRTKYCSSRCRSRRSSLTYRHRNLQSIRKQDRNNIMFDRMSRGR